MKTILSTGNPTEWFRAARDRTMAGGEPLAPAPGRHAPARFNWALDWFDRVPCPGRCAVIVVGEDRTRRASYAELSRASDRVANYLRRRGGAPGDRVLIAMRNSLGYYEVVLACMKLGMPVVPVFTDLPRADLEDRMRRAGIRHVVADADLIPLFSGAEPAGLRIAAGTSARGWLPLADADGCPEDFVPPRETPADHPVMGYFTSGTTSRPKLVLHSHASQGIGHLSSLYWHGLGPGDVHANVSPPGWAKHAWSSLFVPFSAEATALVFEGGRPDPGACLRALAREGVTSFCAPPSYWRALVREGLGTCPGALRQAVSAGESLDGHVADLVLRAWGVRVRNGYGQSEATAMIGVTPGQEAPPGVLGYALPGYSIRLVDPATGEVGDEGEICLDLGQRPAGLMLGYVGPAGAPALPPGRYYRTGDLARRDARGCFHLLGRADDVFKSYDVRISPLELEATLRAHPLVADAAVFAVTDSFCEPVPGAALVPADGTRPEVLIDGVRRWQRERLPEAYRVVRFWVVSELPKTSSGKINRAALRARFTQPII